MSSLCLTLIKSSWLNSSLELATLTLELVSHSRDLALYDLSFTLISFDPRQWPSWLSTIIFIYKWTLALRGTTSGETLEVDRGCIWLRLPSETRPVIKWCCCSYLYLFALSTLCWNPIVGCTRRGISLVLKTVIRVGVVFLGPIV